MLICRLMLPIRLAIRHVLLVLLVWMPVSLSVRQLLLLLLLMRMRLRMVRVLPHGLVRMRWHSIGTGLLLLHIHDRWVHLKWSRSAHHDGRGANHSLLMRRLGHRRRRVIEGTLGGHATSGEP